MPQTLYVYPYHQHLRCCIKKPHQEVDKSEDVGTIEAGGDSIHRTDESITTRQTGTRPMTMSDSDRVREDIDSRFNVGSHTLHFED